MRIVACLLEKKIDIIIITRTIYQTSKIRKKRNWEKFCIEKKRQNIGYDVKKLKIYTLGEILKCTPLF